MGTMLALMESSRRAPAKPLPTGPRAAEIKRKSRERRFDSNTKQIIPPGMEQNKSERNLTAVIPPRKPPPAAPGPGDPRCTRALPATAVGSRCPRDHLAPYPRPVGEGTPESPGLLGSTPKSLIP
jgi:hypothetical protein